MFSGNGPFKVVSGELNYKALIDGPGHESLDGWDNQYQSEEWFTKVCEVGTRVDQGVEDDEVAGQAVD